MFDPIAGRIFAAVHRLLRNRGAPALHSTIVIPCGKRAKSATIARSSAARGIAEHWYENVEHPTPGQLP